MSVNPENPNIMGSEEKEMEFASSPLERRESSSSTKSKVLTPIVSEKPGAATTPILADVIHPIRTNATTEEELFRALSRRLSPNTNNPNAHDKELAQIEGLLATIFGGQAQQDEQKHAGVVFKDLTVKGVGFGASLQPTNSNVFMVPMMALKKLIAGKAWARQKPIRTLLHEFTGCIRPQEMLLVLGRPGSGCSTFLKVIGNQRNGYEDVLGEVTYGGIDAKTMAKMYRGQVLYNPEEDLHYATLTVKETLSFALKTTTPEKSARGFGVSRKDYVKKLLGVISKLFWIEHTLDTKVGDEMVRGVSGGEKKRVSIAEAMVTKASTQCWDNSTRGLDASTAVEYVTSLRSLTNMAKVSTLVALYQAGEQLYELFDKIILIDQGRCMYFGPTERAKHYFEDLGFYCPPRWTTADFLTSVTDPQERHVKPGWESRIPRTPHEFETTFQQSEIAHANLRDIESFENSLKGESVGVQEPHNSSETQNYKISFLKQVVALVSRQYKIMIGDPVVLYGKWLGLLFQSLIIGSLFYNLRNDVTGNFPKGGLLFFTLLFQALLALAELTSAFSSRPILMKHKSFSFYRPSAFALAQVVLDLPFALIQVLIWGIITYFMANLRRTASSFFIFILISYVLALCMSSFFRMLGAFTSSLDGATRITGVSIQILVVYTGYLIPPSSMKPWFSWLRWINPIQYGFEALMANEFSNLQIQCVAPYLIPPSGPGITTENQSCLVRGSTSGSTVVDGSNYIWSQFNYTRSHLWRNFGIIIGFWIFFIILNAIGMELQKPNKGGASITVFKRGQAPKSVQDAVVKSAASSDEEGGEKVIFPKDTSLFKPGPLGETIKNDTVFTWQDLTYTIHTKSGPKILLNNVNGYVKPGRLTALMGESGAGKTTLLNTLAQRITIGSVQGTFLVNGKPLPRSFQRSTAFAEQQDVHEPTMTVREALRFSALLRRPKTVPIEEKYEHVEHIIELLEMTDFAGAVIGTPGSGLNQEQRKLVTIGVELASKPELLMFFDEPTSGLDSAAAFHIIRYLRTLADLGQIVFCTIHQPSSVLFEYFDELILLKRGGQMVYQGPLGTDSQIMIQYFQQNGGRQCREGENPAEYMLDVIGAGDPNRKEKDWAQVWTGSPECRQRSQEIAQMNQEACDRTNQSSLTTDDSEFAMPWASQVKAVLLRTFASYWRSPEYVSGMFILHIFTGLFNSFTFYKLGFSVIDMQSRLFSIFLTLTIAPPLIQQLQPKFLNLRDIFTTRENKAKIYHWSAFVISAIVVELPYRIVAGTLYYVAWFFPVGFPRDSFSAGYMWLIIMGFEFYYLGFGQAIASFSPNVLLASILVPIFFLFVISFCGVVVPPQNIIKFWRSWMYHISPFTYITEGLVGVLTHNVPVRCTEEEFAVFSRPANATCQDYVGKFLQRVGGYVEQVRQNECRFCQFKNGDEFARSFGVEYAHRWRAFGLLIFFIALNFTIVFVGSWLYLGGARRIMKKFKREGRS